MNQVHQLWTFLDVEYNKENLSIDEEKVSSQRGVVKLFLRRTADFFIAPLHIIRRCVLKDKVAALVLLTDGLVSAQQALYLSNFTEHNPMNVLFMAEFVAFCLSYFICRRLNITPFVDSEKP